MSRICKSMETEGGLELGQGRTGEGLLTGKWFLLEGCNVLEVIRLTGTQFYQFGKNHRTVCV